MLVISKNKTSFNSCSNTMKIRRNFLPSSFIDSSSFLFISAVIPFEFCFGLFYLLPSFYPPYSFWYDLHAVLGSFVFVNIVTNFMLIMVADTSVDRAVTPKCNSKWNFCTKCQLHIPPRAWHCVVCDRCILRRDHHCQFTGCCIGHSNYRYFFFFLVYTAIGASYTFYFHTRYLIRSFTEYLVYYREFYDTSFKGVMLSLSYSVQDGFILLYGINVFGAGCALFFTYWHATTMAKGLVLYERARGIDIYDCGSVRRNVLQVLGRRWHLAWISPVVCSPLPGDGTEWVKNDSSKRPFND